MLRIGVAPCSPFSVTGDLLSSPRSWPGARACGCTPTCARPWTRRPSAGSISAARRCDYVEIPRLAGPRRLVRPLRCTCRIRRSRVRRPPAPSVRALPDLQCPARLRHRAVPGPAGRRRGGRPRRGRRRLQRGLLAAGGGPARAAGRPGPRRPARRLTVRRGAGAWRRWAARAAGPRARARLAGGRQARRLALWRVDDLWRRDRRSGRGAGARPAARRRAPVRRRPEVGARWRVAHRGPPNRHRGAHRVSRRQAAYV